MMRQLADVLGQIDGGRALWWVSAGESYCAEDIAVLVAEVRRRFAGIQGKRVAIQTRSALQLASMLVSLDGFCRQLLVLPANLHPDQRGELFAASATDCLIGDVNEPSIASGCRVYRWDSELLRGSAADAHVSIAGIDDGDIVATDWLLCTSGTTGTPKLASHTIASLTRTCKRDTVRGREFRWGSLYNLSGFAGLQVFLQSWCAGSTLVIPPGDVSLEARLNQFISARVNCLSATPTMWRKLLMLGGGRRLELRRITLGGEIVDQPILDALRREFPQARIVHIYASTEAGVGFAVRDGRAGFPDSYLRGALPDTRLRVSEDGHLWIGRVSDGIKTPPVDSRDAMIDTGDVVRKEGDRWHFCGRADGTINVGGNKVHPEEVESCLLASDMVRLARVRARKSPFMGSLVEAEVVPTEATTDTDAWKKRLLQWCRRQLPPYKIPAVLRVVPSLDLTDSGKLRRTA